MLAVVFVASESLREKGLASVGRHTMTDLGRTLIKNAKREVIMFGGDMSWANDYVEAIRDVVRNGKHVTIVHPRSDSKKTLSNATLLEEAGAKMLATEEDTGLRAMLIDHEDSRDALLFVADRTLRKNASELLQGTAGNDELYEYVARVYDLASDWPLIKAVANVFRMIEKRS
jgi:hypothetical protein